MRWKKPFFTLCLVGIVVIASEILCYATLSILEGRLHHPHLIAVRQRAVMGQLTPDAEQELAAADWLPHRLDGNVIHPYLGYVHRPTDASMDPNAPHLPLEALGMGSDGGEVLRAKDEETVAVGIFGGSVAFYLSRSGEIDRLSDALRAIPRFAGKKIVYARVALGGYKQPQQLLAYSYLLSLGGHFDVVINLDGFNDIALAPVENAPKNVNLSYPRGWFFLANDVDADFQKLEVALRSQHDRRVAYAHAMHPRPRRWSSIVSLAWYAGDLILARRERGLQAEILSLRSNTQDYAVTGPRLRTDNLESQLRLLADLWRQSSLQMHRLSEANEALYFHFLQPNQYDSGSKPMENEERALVTTNANLVAPVSQGYPLLRQSGESLRAKGVFFHDVSGLFRGHNEPLYVDDCCHVNEEGNSLLARAIANAIAADLRSR